MLEVTLNSPFLFPSYLVTVKHLHRFFQLINNTTLQEIIESTLNIPAMMSPFSISTTPFPNNFPDASLPPGIMKYCISYQKRNYILMYRFKPWKLEFFTYLCTEILFYPNQDMAPSRHIWLSQ